jgi:hypothetical protein
MGAFADGEPSVAAKLAGDGQLPAGGLCAIVQLQAE